MREIVHLIIQAIVGLVVALAALFVIAEIPRWRAGTKSRLVLLGLDVMERLAKARVAQAEVGTVAPLKDVRAPGEWTPRAAELVKHQVLTDLLAQLPAANRAAIEAGGINPRAMADGMIEAAVLDLKASGAAARTTPSLAAPAMRASLAPPEFSLLEPPPGEPRTTPADSPRAKRLTGETPLPGPPPIPRGPAR